MIIFVLVLLIEIVVLVAVSVWALYLLGASVGVFFGAPYVGTKNEIAKDMLTLGEAGAQDVVLDLGCGQGNILAAALQDFEVKKVIGYDIAPSLALLSRLRLKRLAQYVAKAKQKAEPQVEVYARNVLHLREHKDVTLVTLYLLPPLMEKLRPLLLEKLPHTARIVSHGFTFDGVKPLKEERIHNATLRVYAMSDLMPGSSYERGNNI